MLVAPVSTHSCHTITHYLGRMDDKLFIVDVHRCAVQKIAIIPDLLKIATHERGARI